MDVTDDDLVSRLESHGVNRMRLLTTGEMWEEIRRVGRYAEAIATAPA